MIDIGINFTDKAFREDITECINNALSAGVTHMIVTGTQLQCTENALALCQDHPQTLFSTAGVHPHYSSNWNAEVSASIKELLQQDKVVASGETGLDFNRDFSPRPAQIKAFNEQLELAGDAQKPVFLHERDAFDTQIAILKEHRDQLTGGVIHCFTGNEQALKAYLDLDLYVGITGWVCDERRGQELQQLVTYIPDNRILIETDGPYLLPRDLKPKPKSRRNEPKYLPHIAKTIAKLRQQDEADFIAHTRRNTTACFQLSLDC